MRLLIIASLVLAACSREQGRQIDLAAVQGIGTQAQALEVLGEPSTRGRTEAGLERWLWVHAVGRAFAFGTFTSGEGTAVALTFAGGAVVGCTIATTASQGSQRQVQSRSCNQP